jgi:D-alanyl-D-alanine carboxypeptidase/D-alanyl-D-alanine-endopeptidase (penicillin-binding protein 4)
MGKRTTLGVLILALLPAALGADNSKSGRKSNALAEKIASLLTQPDLERGFWGVQVVSLDNPQDDKPKNARTGPAQKILYSLNADKLFVPASNTKLFTTVSALALVGPDYRFHTTVEANAPLDKYGRIDGDVILVGRGDPNLSGRTLPYAVKTERAQSSTIALENLADQLVKAGVKYIDGDVVADDSFYVNEPYGVGWSQDDLQWGFGAAVSALTINDNLISLNILPGERPGDRAFVTLDPPTAYYKVENRILTVATGGAHKIGVHRDQGSRTVTVWGTVTVNDGPDREDLAAEDPASFAAQLFYEILVRHGIVVYGHTRVQRTDSFSVVTENVPAAALTPLQSLLPAATNRASLVLASYDSAPFIEDLRVVNKTSQNLHAELALRLIGKTGGGIGNSETGLRVEENVLTQAGLTPDEYDLHDGCGLSRENLVSPAAQVKLLQFAAAQPWAARFQDTLPVAGVDGSLADRWKGSDVVGHVRAKTGTMDHVNALSGYATTLSGRNLAFSIMVNNHALKNGRVREVIDQIVEAMVDDQPEKK